MGVLDCFYVCLTANGLLVPLGILSAVTALLFVAFYFDRGFKPLLGAQLGLTGVVSVSLASMDCYMSTWIWGYLGFVLLGGVLIAAFRHRNHKRLLRESLGSFPSLADMEGEFGVAIIVLDTQRVRAVAHNGTVYLSVGLLEKLDSDELRAVVAHEVYHLKRSPSRLLSLFLALTSLTFVRYQDEGAADEFAAEVAGADAIASALETLEIQDHGDRAEHLGQ
jgi:heat shock protein HtpX